MKTKRIKLQTRINRRDTLPALQAFPNELLRESRSESKKKWKKEEAFVSDFLGESNSRGDACYVGWCFLSFSEVLTRLQRTSSDQLKYNKGERN